MAQVVVFTSPKGGSGATSACALAGCMLSQEGQKVLAVDVSFERCTLDFALGFQNEYIYTFADVINGGCSFEEALCRGTEVDFLRADYESGFFSYEKALRMLKNANYDFVLIDAQPFDKECARVLFASADKTVIVTDCTEVSCKLVQTFADSTEDMQNAYVLMNKIVPYYIRDGVHLTADEVIDVIGYPLLGLVPWDCGAEFVFKDIHTLDSHPALKEVFSNIAKRLMGQNVPACDIEGLFKSGITHKYFTKGRK